MTCGSRSNRRSSLVSLFRRVKSFCYDAVHWHPGQLGKIIKKNASKMLSSEDNQLYLLEKITKTSWSRACFPG